MRSVRAAAVVLALVVPALAGTARAAVEPAGHICTALTVQDLNDPWAQRAVLQAGPVTLTDPDAPGTVVRGSVLCVVRVGETHEGAVLAAAESPTTPVAATLPPTPVWYVPDHTYSITFCTEVHVEGGPTLYWDDVAGTWTTDPTVICDDWY
jgi:hypothetical protein